MKAIKEKAQKDREFIAEIRRDETKFQILAGITRSIAIMMYINESYRNLSPVLKFVNKYGKDVIIKSLLIG